MFILIIKGGRSRIWKTCVILEHSPNLISKCKNFMEISKLIFVHYLIHSDSAQRKENMRVLYRITNNTISLSKVSRFLLKFHNLAKLCTNYRKLMKLYIRCYTNTRLYYSTIQPFNNSSIQLNIYTNTRLKTI